MLLPKLRFGQSIRKEVKAMKRLDQWKELKKRYGLKTIAYDELMSLPQETRDSFFEEASQILPGLLDSIESLLNNLKIYRAIDKIIDKGMEDLS